MDQDKLFEVNFSFDKKRVLQFFMWKMEKTNSETSQITRCGMRRISYFFCQLPFVGRKLRNCLCFPTNCSKSGSMQLITWELGELWGIFHFFPAWCCWKLFLRAERKAYLRFRQTALELLVIYFWKIDITEFSLWKEIISIHFDFSLLFMWNSAEFMTVFVIAFHEKIFRRSFHSMSPISNLQPARKDVLSSFCEKVWFFSWNSSCYACIFHSYSKSAKLKLLHILSFIHFSFHSSASQFSAFEIYEFFIGSADEWGKRERRGAEKQTHRIFLSGHENAEKCYTSEANETKHWVWRGREFSNLLNILFRQLKLWNFHFTGAILCNSWSFLPDILIQTDKSDGEKLIRDQLIKTSLSVSFHSPSSHTQ